MKPRSLLPLILLAVCLVLALVLFLGHVLHKQAVTLPVTNKEEPIPRQSEEITLPAGKHYATIDIPMPSSVAMNAKSNIVGYSKNSDGSLNLLACFGFDVFDVTKATGQQFAKVLDINDRNEVIGLVTGFLGRIYLKGYRLEKKDNALEATELNRDELQHFGLEDLTIKTDLALDSVLSESEYGRVTVGSIVDMNKSGVLLAAASPKATPDPRSSSSMKVKGGRLIFIDKNSHGEILAEFHKDDGAIHLVVIFPAGGFFDFSDEYNLPVSQALAINDDGEVLGLVVRDGSTFLRGFRYRHLFGKNIQTAALDSYDLSRFKLTKIRVTREMIPGEPLPEWKGRKVTIQATGKADQPKQIESVP